MSILLTGFMRKKRPGVSPDASIVRPAWIYSNGCKSLTHPDSGKCLANAKGVHREVESKGRSRQTSGLTNRNRIKG